MRYIVKYYYIKSDHIFAVPEYDHEEIVNVKKIGDLHKYIESKKDQYGHYFKYSANKSFGFNYISGAGGVKIKLYKEPIIKQI